MWTKICRTNGAPIVPARNQYQSCDFRCFFRIVFLQCPCPNQQVGATATNFVVRWAVQLKTKSVLQLLLLIFLGCLEPWHPHVARQFGQWCQE